ncbi:hypothetical protein Lal_00013513 [Lupinus albus]|nr:hypothetical protein Lal_00013513 [Lupinus albus]
MDALDTQNQQIQYELHRLSSRLNSMDIDEDSYESKHITPKERGSIQDRGEHTQDKSRNITKYVALRKLHYEEDIGLSSSKKGRL